MALVNNRNSILGSFEKSLEIIKTEKELVDALGEKITRLKIMQNHINGVKSEIVSLLNEQPSEERTYYMSDNSDDMIDNEFSYLTFNISYAKDDAISNMTIDSMTNGEEERNAMKSKFNDISRKYFSIQEKIIELTKLKNNLRNSPTKIQKLSISDLEKYGF